MARLSSWSRCRDVAVAYPDGCANLRGATTIITGPTAGIGVCTAKALAATGGHLVLAARSLAKAEALAADIASSVPGSGPVHCIALDLNSLASVARFAEEFGVASDNAGWPPLRCLVCNAGLLNLSGSFTATADGFEATFGVNHLGHFLLTSLLLPRLRAAAPARVVVVSSETLFGPLAEDPCEDAQAWRRLALPDERVQSNFSGLSGSATGLRHYGSSKLANACFVRALADKYGDEGIGAACLHPGSSIATDITRDLPTVVRWLHRHVMSCFTKDVDQGSSTTLFCCLVPHDALRGGYFADCKECPASKSVTATAAQELWRVSSELCGAFMKN